MARVAARHPGVTLRLYDRLPGDDPGFADSFGAPGLGVEWVERAPYKTFLAGLDNVAIGLAPLCPQTPFSRGKSFGKVLAYLDRGVPVVASDAGEHAGFFTPATGVISNDTEVWVAQILRLLDDPAARHQIADAAHARFCRDLSVGAAAAGVDRVLRSVIEGDAPARAG